MTALEGGAGDDATLFHGPGGSVTVLGTRISDQLGIWAVC